MEVMMKLAAYAERFVPEGTTVSAEEYINLINDYGKTVGKELPQATVDYIRQLGGRYGGKGAPYKWSSKEVDD